jgi:hypothetical protein
MISKITRIKFKFRETVRIRLGAGGKKSKVLLRMLLLAHAIAGRRRPCHNPATTFLSFASLEACGRSGRGHGLIMHRQRERHPK